MAVPSVAILGRANVGKSTLFNALCGHRIAIVDSEPGITRDRVVRKVDCNGITVELVDTGGVGMESAEEIADDVDMQIQTAIVEADLVLLVVDARQGIHPLDRRIARRLR
ncbi:MAG: GTPase [Planctomycetota bacterium]